VTIGIAPTHFIPSTFRRAINRLWSDPLSNDENWFWQFPSVTFSYQQINIRRKLWKKSFRKIERVDLSARLSRPEIDLKNPLNRCVIFVTW
jgi:hypothetical protein